MLVIFLGHCVTVAGDIRHGMVFVFIYSCLTDSVMFMEHRIRLRVVGYSLSDTPILP